MVDCCAVSYRELLRSPCIISYYRIVDAGYYGMVGGADPYRINLNKRTVCYVVGVAPSGKVCQFLFFSRLLFCCVFRPFSKVGNS